MPLERSLAARSATSVLYEDVNDIDIFIEDTGFGYEKLFRIIFSRVFSGRYKVDKVFPLGGRNAVLEEYNRQIAHVTRPSLFIIDGDLYLLTGYIFENRNGLYTLPFYCIENLLINGAALHFLLDEEDPERTGEALAQDFDYEGWVDQNKSELFELFVEYAVSFVVNPSEQTVAHPCNRLISSNSGCIDTDKTRARVSHLKTASIAKVGEDLYKEIKSQILENFSEISSDVLDIISGKDYLWPLVKLRFKSVVNTKIPDINFKQRLAQKCDISMIEDCMHSVAS
jgi:Protein of unknown function (DUF4435)